MIKCLGRDIQKNKRKHEKKKLKRMKCPNCNSEEIEDVSDLSHKIYVCKKCSFYWIEEK